MSHIEGFFTSLTFAVSASTSFFKPSQNGVRISTNAFNKCKESRHVYSFCVGLLENSWDLAQGLGILTKSTEHPLYSQGSSGLLDATVAAWLKAWMTARMASGRSHSPTWEPIAPCQWSYSLEGTVWLWQLQYGSSCNYPLTSQRPAELPSNPGIITET